MKKVLCLFIMLIGMCLLSCNKKEEEKEDVKQEHEHELSDWIVEKEATCVEKGVRKKKCNICNEELEIEEIEKIAHKEGQRVTEQSADSIKEYIKCEICEAILSEKTLEITKNLIYEFNNDGKSYKVTGLDGEIEDVVIPSTYGGLPVTVIGDYAFEEIESEFSIYIPSSIVLIEYGAFSNNIGIESIVIPANVEEIEGGVFEGCTNLKSCIFENGSQLKSIGENAFADCNQLENIVLPETVEVIESGAFQMCNTFTSFTMPKSIKEIGIFMLDSCEGLKTLIFEEGIEKVSLNIIDGCVSLETIIIPASALEIEIEEMEGLDSLKCIQVSEGNTNYKTIDGNLYSKDGNVIIKYAQGKTEKEFKVGKNVTKIDKYAFYDARNLENIILNEGLESIERNAFAYCEKLEELLIPNSIINIEGSAFNECNNLKYNVFDNAKYLGNDENKYLILIKANETNITECLVNKDTRHIASSAFADCDNLKYVLFEDNCQLLTIGSGAFYGCNSLIEIEIPNTVVSIGSSAFGFCNSLERVIIPESVTVLEEGAFYQSSNLTIYCLANERPEGWDEYFYIIGVTIDGGLVCGNVIWDCNGIISLSTAYQKAVGFGFDSTYEDWLLILENLEYRYIKDVVLVEDSLYLVLSNDTSIFVWGPEQSGDLLLIENCNGVIVDSTLANIKKGESFVYIDEKTYIMGNGIFSSVNDALSSRNNDNKYIINLVSGTYEENFTLTKGSVIIQGPNLGNDPNGTVRRYKEAIISGIITIPAGINDVTIKGLKFTDNSQIIGVKGEKGTASNININHSNLLFSNNIVDVKLNSGVNGFIYFEEANNSYSQNIKIVNNSFTIDKNTKAKNVIFLDNNIDLQVKNNVFKNIPIRAFYVNDTTKGCSGSGMEINGNTFENIKGSGIYINWLAPYNNTTDSKFYIDENIFKNVGTTEEDFAIYLGKTNNGNIIETLSISRNEFSNCTSCIKVERCHINALVVLDSNVFEDLPKYYYVICSNAGTPEDNKRNVLVLNSTFKKGYFDNYFLGDVTVE